MAINSINNGIGHKSQTINENQNNQPVAKQQNTPAASGIASNIANDTVNLTGTASQLRALEQQIASLPVVDVQRVESIKQEISNGSYQIDPPRIAEKMIQIESAINQRLI